MAFENPDGGRVVVVTNAGAARPVVLEMGNMESEIMLEKNSIATLVWS